MSNQQGWIRLHRQLLEWEWFDEPNVFRLFIYCLLKANHQDRNYKGQVIKRGTFVTSFELLSQETKISVQSVRTSLKRLESTGELTSVKTSKGTVIQVVKYDDYQDSNTPTNKQVTSNQQATNKQVTTNNNDKNVKNNNIPTYEDFKTFALIKQPDVSLEHLKYKYDAWVENGWKNGNDRVIKNWKSSLLQTLPHIPKQPTKVRNLDQEAYENIMRKVNGQG